VIGALSFSVSNDRSLSLALRLVESQPVWSMRR